MRKLISVLSTLVLTLNLIGQSSEFDSFIVSYAKDHNFNGTILIQNGGQIQYHQSFGYANQQFKVPNSNETKYKIASITKLFTATLILQLYEQGKIDLIKTIQTYLPNYTGEGAEKVTIHQLLNHTSGMVNYDTVKSVESAVKNGPPPIYQKTMTTDEILEQYCSSALVHEPGKVFDYNNSEYIILGKIIEHLYGKPFEQVLKENILQPLKIINSDMLYQFDIIDGLADTFSSGMTLIVLLMIYLFIFKTGTHQVQCIQHRMTY
jgi:D-alanyl-D-alanine carboxypeptidase